MLAYVARQPILTETKELFGYELLFRDGTTNHFSHIDGDEATSQLISDSYLSIGLDRITCGNKSFINFTENLLLSRTPYTCPPETTVLEIPEGVTVSDSLVKSLKKLKQSGYAIALDNFVYSDEKLPLIRLADFIKIDFIKTNRADIKTCSERLKSFDVTLLAERIETPDEFEFAKKTGFTLFQGYFFCKPEIIQGTSFSGFKINLLRILVEVNKKDFSFSRLEEMMSGDLSINYKLLKYINSAYYGRRQRIDSISHAIKLLGEIHIRQFISLFTITRLSDEKPHELLKLSCIRARFCENMSRISTTLMVSHELFSLGMFSLIDAVLGSDMEKVMGELPLKDELKSALIDQSGVLGDFLKIAISYERADWEALDILSEKHGIAIDTFPDLYMEACEWTDSFTI